MNRSSQWVRVSVREWRHASGMFLLLDGGCWQLYGPDVKRIGPAFYSRFQAIAAVGSA